MNKLYLFLLSLLSLTACTQEEVPTFASERGINFLVYNELGDTYTDNYELLTTTHNFFADYAGTNGWQVSEKTLKVGLSLEGTLSTTPVRIKIKAQPVEGYDFPELTLPDSCIIDSGEYRTNFSVVVKKPQTYDKEYRAALTIDYANSDVVAGTKERQTYTLIISDATDWSALSLSNQAEWETALAANLGTYGPNKVRHILVTFGLSPSGQQLSYSQIRSLFYSTRWASSGFGTATRLNILRNSLTTYQTTYGQVLTEPDGTVVTF